MLKLKHFFVVCIALTLGITANAQQGTLLIPQAVKVVKNSPTVKSATDTDATRANAAAYIGNYTLSTYGSIGLNNGIITNTGAFPEPGGMFPVAEEYVGKVYRIYLDLTTELSYLYEVNPDNGNINPLGVITGLPAGSLVVGMTYNWANNMMYVVATENVTAFPPPANFPSHICTLDLTTRNATLVGTSTDQCLLGIDFAEDGFIYGVTTLDDNLYKIDPATGATTAVGSLGFDIQGATSISYDFDSHQLYIAGFDGDNFVSRFGTCDLATGAFTQIRDMGPDFFPTLVITNTPPGVPVSNWAIILGVALLIGFGIFRFFK